MELVEKPWKHGIYLAYNNIGEDYLKFEIKSRVLPAPYFYEPKRRFLLLEQFQPGSEKPWQDGGFHVWDEDNSEHRFFWPNQVIVHPDLVAKKKQKVETIQILVEEKNIPKGHGKRGRRPLNPELKKQRELEKANHVPGKRGRKPLDPEVKAQREAEKASKKANGTGKRGRPPMDPALRKTKPYVKTGGKRGRPKKNQ